MKAQPPLVFIFCSALLSFVSCASVSHYGAIDASIASGNYPEAVEQLHAAKDSSYGKNDQVLYYLEDGMLSYYAKNYEESSKSLGIAERGIEEAFTKSVTLSVSSYLVNDNTLEYAGEDYEDIYLNAFNSLNYYHSGSVEDALVEIRRIDNKLKYLSTKYGTAISNAQSAVLEKSADIPYDSESARIEFTNSALARYIGMLFYRAEGMYDDARIDRDQVKLAFANQPSVYGFPLPSTLNDELVVPKGKARLNVISFSGMSPIKTEDVVRIPLGDTNWIKISLPVMMSRPSAVARIEVALDSGERFDLEQIEDIGAISAETFRQRASLIYLKTVLRSIAKTSSSIAMKETSNKADSSDAALLLGLLSIGTQIYAEASEQADLRISRYFPSKAHVGGINLDPGVCSYTVRYYGASGQVIHEQRFDNVELRAGALNLSEAICIK
jgi:hypothetical protein